MITSVSLLLGAYVTGAGLNRAKSLCRPQWSAQVCLRPLATSRRRWKISQPTSSMVAWPVAIRAGIDVDEVGPSVCEFGARGYFDDRSHGEAVGRAASRGEDVHVHGRG